MQVVQHPLTKDPEQAISTPNSLLQTHKVDPHTLCLAPSITIHKGRLGAKAQRTARVTLSYSNFKNT